LLDPVIFLIVGSSEGYDIKTKYLMSEGNVKESRLVFRAFVGEAEV
jgi:hypothetical protein